LRSDIPPGHNAFIYVYQGEVTVAGTGVAAQRMAILANNEQADGVVIRTGADARALLISGQPLKESIVQYGPFVMNSQQEIYQALSDFRDGRLGELTGSA
jgi:quercetin 2,3-dioxygenase